MFNTQWFYPWWSTWKLSKINPTGLYPSIPHIISYNWLIYTLSLQLGFTLKYLSITYWFGDSYLSQNADIKTWITSSHLKSKQATHQPITLSPSQPISSIPPVPRLQRRSPPMSRNAQLQRCTPCRRSCSGSFAASSKRSSRRWF